MTRTVTSPWALAVVVLSLAGCDPWDGEEMLGLTYRTRTITTGPDGYATVRIPRDDVSFTKLLLAAGNAENGRSLYVDRVEDSGGRALRRFLADIDLGTWPTGAVALQELNHLNWPISDADPAIAGDQLRVVIGAVNQDNTLAPNVSMEIQVLQSTDTDLSRGTLGVNLIYAGDIADDEHMVASFDEAAERMRSIFDAVDLDLEIFKHTWPEGNLPRPGFGAPQAWTDLTTATDNLAVDVVIVYDIAGSEPEILGAAGSIPGGLLGSYKSGVILSATSNAGPDLRFSNAEIDLLSTTMGHELGHMMGLFHPVELTYDRWDALGDTERCTNASSCQGALGTNLMYPSALCSQSGCLYQADITPNQASVLHRYTGVR